MIFAEEIQISPVTHTYCLHFINKYSISYCYLRKSFQLAANIDRYKYFQYYELSRFTHYAQ